MIYESLSLFSSQCTQIIVMFTEQNKAGLPHTGHVIWYIPIYQTFTILKMYSSLPQSGHKVSRKQLSYCLSQCLHVCLYIASNMITPLSYFYDELACLGMIKIALFVHKTKI